MKEYQQLINNISQIILKYDEMDRINGSKFNIFQILNVAEDELKHSLFIAELLNPKGRHGRGSLFLKLFLEKVEITDFDTENSTIETEKYIGPITETEGGRIDIFLEDKDRKTIVIENKIYAGDMPQQLIRYYNFAPDNVLYLTLNGDSPSESSIIHPTKQLNEVENFKIISYKSHIVDWLESCKKESFEYPLLREGLTHYINLIKYLTGQSTNQKMEEEILKLAFENKKNFEMIAVIGNNYDSIKAQFHFRFWKALKFALITKKLTIEDHRNTIKSIQDLKKNNGLWILIKRIYEFNIYYSIFFDDCVYCGITIEINEEFIGTKPNIYNELAKILLNSNLNFQPSQYRLGDKKITPQIDFLNLNNYEIFNFVDDSYLNDYTNTLAKKINDEISNFQEKINDYEINI